MGTATLPHVLTLTPAEQRALLTMTQHGRCVGAHATDPRCGYVNTNAARALVKLGLAVEDRGHSGAAVFIISEEGAAVYLAAFLDEIDASQGIH